MAGQSIRRSFLTPVRLVPMSTNAFLRRVRACLAITSAVFIAGAFGSPIASGQTIVAYAIDEGTNGNQEFGGSLGMDFIVNGAITVLDLGVFDSGSDGLNTFITAELWTRDDGGTPTEPGDDFGIEVIATLDFAPGDDGTAMGGSRFKPLPAPLDLPPGAYTIVAAGYGAGEPNYNLGGRPGDPEGLHVNDGRVLTFVGGSRWGDFGTFPGNADGGPANRYGAGTFTFEATDSDGDTMPDWWEDANGLDKSNPADATLDGDSDGALNRDEFARESDPENPDTDGDGLLDGPETKTGTWVGPNDRGTDPTRPDSDSDGIGDAEESNSGTFVDADDTGSNPNLGDSDGDGFDDGLELGNGSDPNIATSVPARFGEAAYQIAGGTVGTQNFTGALGMDFVVNATVHIEQLGVFDSAGDGIMQPLTVELWERDDNGTPNDFTDDIGISVLAMAEFQPGDGYLQGANRFKPLAQTLDLEPGSYSIVAYGFSDFDLNYNLGARPGEPEGLTTSPSPTITFVGTSRFGDPDPIFNGTFPPNVDGGGPNQYGAGTFAFSTDDSDADGMLDFWEDLYGFDKLDPSDAAEDSDIDGLTNLDEFQQETHPREPDTDQDGLNDGDEVNRMVEGQPAPTDPLVADTDQDGLGDGDEVNRMVGGQPAPTDPLVADTDGDEFSDGREVAEGSDPLDPQSIPVITFLGELAYRVLEGTVGNQTFGGALGMDFVVGDTIRVVELGAFDSGSDGLSRTITVQLWSRDDGGTPDDPGDDTGAEILAEEVFSPGNAGDLRDGSTVRKLDPPIFLEPGAYTISAGGYGPGEPNGNNGVGAFPEGTLTVSDAPEITFVGTSRFGADPVSFPDTPDGGPENRYAAGTFAFDTEGGPPFAITDIVFDPATRSVTLTWNSRPGKFYRVEFSEDLARWLEATDGVASGGTETSYVDEDVPEGSKNRAYRIAEE